MRIRTLTKFFLGAVIIAFSYNFIQAQETIITKNELPKNAQELLNKHFKHKTISYIKKDKEVFSTDYKVKFTDMSDIKFDSNGNWEEIDGENQPISDIFIPAKIKSYLNKHFPETQVFKIEKKSLKQEVKLSNGLEIIFNKSGDFVRIDD